MKRILAVMQTKQFKLGMLFVAVVMYVLAYQASKTPNAFKQFGYAGVFLFNVFGPGATLLPVMVNRTNLVALVFLSAAGSLVNDSMMWMVGKHGEQVVERGRKTEWLEKAYGKSYSSAVVYALATVPFPFTLLSLTAGYSNYSYKKYVTFVFLGRLTRYLILGLGVLWLGRISFFQFL